MDKAGAMSHLEIDLSRDLDLPLRIHHRPDDSRARITDRHCRQAEVRVVEKVERLPSELQAEALVEKEIAADPEIEVDEAGCAQNITARVPEARAGRRCECSGVKPV